jgi:prepilin peptidase CpaA
MNTGLGSIGAVLAGSATGFFALLPFYLLGGMGAGDVKFFAALGSFLGPFATLLAVALTLVVGALIATGVFVYYRFYDRHRSEPTKADQKNTNGKVVMSFPYAPAIALGTIGTILMA